MVSRRFFTNSASTAALAASLTSTATNISLTSFTGFPTSFPYTATISWGKTDQEVVLVTGGSVSSVTVTRGYNGTGAQAHASGATFDMTPSAIDFDEANAHIQATETHGATGAVVGTQNTQTLTNKTLTGPKLANFATAADASAGISNLGAGTLASIGGKVYQYDGSHWLQLSVTYSNQTVGTVTAASRLVVPHGAPARPSSATWSPMDKDSGGNLIPHYEYRLISIDSTNINLAVYKISDQSAASPGQTAGVSWVAVL